MTSENKNSEETPSSNKTVRLGYYGGSTSLGMLPRDTHWLEEILHFFGIGRDDPKEDQGDKKPTKDQ